MFIDLRARKTVANASPKEDKDAGMYFEFDVLVCGLSVILSSRKRYSSSSLRSSRTLSYQKAVTAMRLTTERT
jgi:hypothetical protein